jgi:spore coat polysaccharide biosynthesis predicted glycosyltransferase SpsG
MKRILFISAAAILAACTTTYETMSRADAVAMCQAQADEAAARTTGNMTLGLNSQTGPSLGFGIGINLTPKPRAQTFESCMNELAANGQIVEES